MKIFYSFFLIGLFVNTPIAFGSSNSAQARSDEESEQKENKIKSKRLESIEIFWPSSDRAQKEKLIELVCKDVLDDWSVEEFDNKYYIEELEDKDEKGQSSGKIFLIKDQITKQLVFVWKEVKGTKKTPASKEINYLQEQDFKRDIGNLPLDFPISWTFPEKIYRSKDEDGQDQYFVLLHGAKGVALQKKLQEYEKNPEKKNELIKNFTNALLKFHLHISGKSNKKNPRIEDINSYEIYDAHYNNFFVEEKNGKYKFYFIDTALARTNEKKCFEFSFLKDLKWFIDYPEYTKKSPKINDQMIDTIVTTICEFFTGDPDEQLKKYIQTQLKA